MTLNGQFFEAYFCVKNLENKTKFPQNYFEEYFLGAISAEMSSL